MGKSNTIELRTCQQIIWYRNGLKYFHLSGERGRNAQRYKEVRNAIGAYLKKNSLEDGSILIYESECLDPQVGGWYDQNRVFHFHKAVYLLTFEQLLRISDMGGKHTEIEVYKITSGRAQKVSREELVRAWFDALPEEVRRKWLEEMLESMLFEKVLENPTRFL